jgi:hypothetical protein
MVPQEVRPEIPSRRRVCDEDLGYSQDRYQVRQAQNREAPKRRVGTRTRSSALQPGLRHQVGWFGFVSARGTTPSSAAQPIAPHARGDTFPRRQRRPLRCALPLRPARRCQRGAAQRNDCRVPGKSTARVITCAKHHLLPAEVGSASQCWCPTNSCRDRAGEWRVGPSATNGRQAVGTDRSSQVVVDGPWLQARIEAPRSWWVDRGVWRKCTRVSRGYLWSEAPGDTHSASASSRRPASIRRGESHCWHRKTDVMGFLATAGTEKPRAPAFVRHCGRTRDAFVCAESAPAPRSGCSKRGGSGSHCQRGGSLQPASHHAHRASSLAFRCPLCPRRRRALTAAA